MHCAWQEAACDPTSNGAGPGGTAGLHTAAFAPAFSTLCADDTAAGIAQSTSKRDQGAVLEVEGFGRLEEIVQVAIVAEGHSQGGAGSSQSVGEGPGNLSLLVLSATGVVSLWAVALSRLVGRTAAGAFLLDRTGAARIMLALCWRKSDKTTVHCSTPGRVFLPTYIHCACTWLKLVLEAKNAT